MCEYAGALDRTTYISASPGGLGSRVTFVLMIIHVYPVTLDTANKASCLDLTSNSALVAYVRGYKTLNPAQHPMLKYSLKQRNECKAARVDCCMQKVPRKL